MIKIKSSLGGWGRALGGLMLSFAATGPSFASDAFVTHNFQITTLQPGQVIKEQWAWNDFAKAVSRPPLCQDSPNQEHDRTDSFLLPFSLEKTADATTKCPRATAKAISKVNAQTPLENLHSVKATATAKGPDFASAFAIAQSALGFKVGTPTGKHAIDWKTNWTVHNLLDTDVRAAGHDPLDVSLLNLDNGQVMSSRLWDSGVSLSGKGSSVWENGHILLDGFNGEFFVTLESPYLTSGSGSMRLLFEGGLVTLSEDTGIFDGLLPLIGELAQMDIAFGDASGAISIEFDFGVTSSSGFELSGETSSEAEASAAVAEPATAWLGLLALAGLALSRRRPIEWGHRLNGVTIEWGQVYKL